MKRSACALCAIGLIVLLSGCGGAGNAGDAGAAPVAAPATEPVSHPSVAVGEPSPAAVPDRAAFAQLAQDAPCSDIHNRMFVIDKALVYWDRAGSCPDASYARVLFGAKPGVALCNVTDSIAGPRVVCADERYRATFESIQGGKADLGLDTSHLIEPLQIAQHVEPVVGDGMSAIALARTVVVKDEAALAALWSEHNADRLTAPALPKVDFSHQMLLGVFSGSYPDSCHALTIVRVLAGGGTTTVEYQDRVLNTLVACRQVPTALAQMVVLERSDDEIVFTRLSGPAQ